MQLRDRFSLPKLVSSTLLVATVLLLFSRVVVSPVDQWLHDADYSHGFLVPILAFWILWQQRRRLAELPVAPSWWGVPIVLVAMGLLVLGTLGAESFDECALCGKVPFTATSADPGTSHLGDSVDKVDVCVTTLDAFLQTNNLRRIDLIKIDTEGCEVRFLWGARRTLSFFPPMLLPEINPRALRDFENTIGELKQVLGELGYEAKRIGWNTLSPNWSPPEDGDYFNILATPS